MTPRLKLPESISNPQRVILMQELEELLQEEVDPLVWALLWCSDLCCLKTMIDGSKRGYNAARDAVDKFAAISTREFLSTYMIHFDTSASNTEFVGEMMKFQECIYNMPYVDSLVTSARRVRYQGRLRSDETFIIAPSLLLPTDASERDRSPTNFWVILRMFFSEERVSGWTNALRDCGTNEGNLLQLLPQAVEYWRKGYFGMKPVGTVTGKDSECRCEFFWFSQLDHNKTIRIAQPPPTDLLGDHTRRSGPGGVSLRQQDPATDLASQDVLTISSINMDDVQIPDFSLLQMQWVLHLVVALAGGV